LRNALPSTGQTGKNNRLLQQNAEQGQKKLLHHPTQELLAIVRILERFHKYFCTNNSALTWLMSFKNLGQTARWMQGLQEYNFTSEHRQGQKHNNADALQRQSCQVECTHCHEVKVPQLARIQQLSELNDQDIGPILEEADTRQHP
jgi:hypothetical protein